jgi:dihydroorotase
MHGHGGSLQRLRQQRKAKRVKEHPHMLNRREFTKYFVAGGAALLTPGIAWSASSTDASPQQNSNQTFDLLIEGGTVIDPGQNLHALLDVAIKAGKIAEISKSIPKERALKIISAKDRIVTSGLIDVHAHCYDGVGIGMNADHYCLPRGVTTVVDAGSAGYATFPNFRKYIITPATTRIVALVNIGAIGAAVGPGSLQNLDWVNPQLTAKTAVDNKPVVVGIKIQLSKMITGTGDMECLKRAVEAAEIARLPLMAHVEDSYSPLPGILNMLRKGDIYTHCFNSRTHNILDANGTIIPEAREARERGVYFDPAQGQTHLNFDIVEKCMQQNFLPDTISTDLTIVTVEKRVFDLPTTVSKFMALGIGLDQAIAMVTSNAVRMFDYGSQVGTLRVGSEADVSIFELSEGQFDFEDSDGGKRTGRQMLINKAVVRRGQVFLNAV